jgi:hypothetical protein
MRNTILALCTLLPFAVWAHPPICGDTKRQHAELLTAAEWQAVLEEKPGDPIVAEQIDHEKAKRAEPASVGDPIPISWEQVRKLVLLGVVRSTYQSHDLTVRLVNTGRRSFVTREPRIDEIQRVAAVVDPCGVYIRHVTE